MILFCLSLSDYLGIISVFLSVNSIMLSIFIYKITDKTFKKTIENSFKTILQSNEEKAAFKSETSMKGSQLEKARKILKRLFFIARLKSGNQVLRINTLDILYSLKKFFNEEQIVSILNNWKEKHYINWDGILEVSTRITILDENDLLQNII